MREETVTRALADCLRLHAWTIYSIDYPQGGSGLTFHADDSKVMRGRLVGAWKPDIVAHRAGTWVFMENKSFFSASDFDKLAEARMNKKYEADMERVLPERPLRHAYGIGLPNEQSIRVKAEARKSGVDFIVFVGEDLDCSLLEPGFPLDEPD